MIHTAGKERRAEAIQDIVKIVKYLERSNGKGARTMAIMLGAAMSEIVGDYAWYNAWDALARRELLRLEGR